MIRWVISYRLVYAHRVCYFQGASVASQLVVQAF